MTTIAKEILSKTSIEAIRSEAELRCNMSVKTMFDTIYAFSDNSSIIVDDNGAYLFSNSSWSN